MSLLLSAAIRSSALREDGSRLLEAAHAAPLADYIDERIVVGIVQLYVSHPSYIERFRQTSAAGWAHR